MCSYKKISKSTARLREQLLITGYLILDTLWWQELDLNQRSFGYEPNEITASPSCYQIPN